MLLGQLSLPARLTASNKIIRQGGLWQHRKDSTIPDEGLTKPLCYMPIAKLVSALDSLVASISLLIECNRGVQAIAEAFLCLIHYLNSMLGFLFLILSLNGVEMAH